MPRLISPFWLLSAAAFYALAFLIPNHTPPWLGFHADALAGFIALLLAGGVAWRSKEKWPISGAAALVILALAVVLAQQALGLIAQLGVAWVNLLYLSGLLLSILIGQLWERSHANECADFIFAAALIGAVISVGMQIQQWLGINLMGKWLLYAQGRYYANLSQPNQLASLMMLGLLACAWFYQRNKFPPWLALTSCIILLFGLSLANSRTSWVTAFLFGASLLMLRRKTQTTSFTKPFFALAIIYICLLFFTPQIHAWIFEQEKVAPIRSLMDQSRLAIWGMLLQGLMLKPWFGYGWGQVGHVQFMNGLPALNVPATLTQSHNLFLDLLLWNGIPLGAFFIASMGGFFLWAWMRIKNPAQLLQIFSIIVLLVHAMLEYPLEYAYFLIPFGLMIGALCQSLQAKVVIYLPKMIGVGLLLFVAAFYSITINDYFKAERSFYGLRFEQRGIATDISPTPPDVVGLTQLRDAIRFARIKPAEQHTQADLLWGESVVQTTPSTLSMYRLASMYAHAGQKLNAKRWMANAVRMSPPEQCYDLAELWQNEQKAHPNLAEISWPTCPKLAKTP